MPMLSSSDIKALLQSLESLNPRILESFSPTNLEKNQNCFLGAKIPRSDDKLFKSFRSLN